MQFKSIDTDMKIDLETIFQQCQIPQDFDVQIILIKTNNPALMTTQKSYDIQICGKSIKEWCLLAFGNNSVIETEAPLNSDILSIIKPLLTNKKYTAVFYADTPLLQKETFLNIMEYVVAKNLTACKLDRGWVFETETIKQCSELQNINIYSGSKEDFFCVFNQGQLSIATEILRKRIIKQHQQNGVQILDTNTTYLDADIKIGKDVIIHSNNHICGKSVIEDSATILPNNIIENSIIKSGIKLSNCVVKNATLSKSPKPFSVIEEGE